MPKNEDNNKSVDKAKAKAKNEDNNKYLCQKETMNILNEYFDKRFEGLELNNKIIDISKNDIVNYDEQIIRVKKGQRLILQMI